LGLELSYNPFSLNPSYQAIASAPLAEKLRELRNPQLRARLIAETPQDPNPFFMFIVSDLEEMFVLGDPPNYHPSRQDSVAAQARQQGLDAREFIYDALLRRDGHEILYRPMGNSGGERYEAAGRNLLKRDLTILGLGDGGAHYSLICDAAYPTYLLTHWSRDAADDRQLPLPWAIKKLTSETAKAVRMNDRGLLMEGYKADINVIDMKRLHLYAPHAVYDLPAGGRLRCHHCERGDHLSGWETDRCAAGTPGPQSLARQLDRNSSINLALHQRFFEQLMTGGIEADSLGEIVVGVTPLALESVERRVHVLATDATQNCQRRRIEWAL
jgi:N-acyl-D-aspartate/D-glutamate deacylase